MARGRWLWMALLLLPSGAWADEVHLRSGGVVRGIIVERSAERVVIQAGPGRVTLPLSRVERIVESNSALATFQARARRLSPTDVEGLAGLARWAEEHDLATVARQTWERVLRLDPNHPEANAAMGRTYYDGAWMSRDDAYRLQGYVSFDGEWVTPQEQQALARASADRALALSQRQAAELRVREAEARAREAEARAREAEAQADQATGSVDGIPYWWVLSGGGGYWPPVTGHPRPPIALPHEPRDPGHRAARPPSSGGTPPRSIWGGSAPGGSRPSNGPREPSSASKSSGSGSIR